MKRFASWLSLSLVLALPAYADPGLPTAVQTAASAAHWQRIGQGEMRWYGLALYQASLWTAGGTHEVTPQTPFAFVIEYARHFSGTRLASTSVSEMRRLQLADEAQLKRWGAELARIFPDVEAGQTITGVNLPGQGVRFWHQDKPLGFITDPSFGRAFFGIWLHENTRGAALRSQLLGQQSQTLRWTP
jgi:hypothetical protein